MSLKSETLYYPRSILRQVEKPARYLGHEWNRIDKSKQMNHGLRKRPMIRFGFCFPDLYEIGMSNLALRILYQVLNAREDVWCERAFAPAPDMREWLLKSDRPLVTLESYTPLREMDIVGFTLQYEMCYPTVLDMLALGGIPLHTADRDATHPLIVAGGPIVYNCEPMTDFIDLFMLGEGEEMIGELIDLYRGWDRQRESRRDFLLRAAQIEGVYVPSFYRAIYAEDGQFRSLERLVESVPRQINKRVVKDLPPSPFPTRPLVPNIEIVHDRVFLELFRGCPRGCRFCQAGMVYRPVREKDADTLYEQAVEMLAQTGYDEIGLLSLSSGDYSQLAELCERLLEVCRAKKINLSLPSLRLDSFSFDLMQKASSTRKAGLTFAPEAGTQSLRDRINKNIQEEDLLTAAELAFAGGWNRLKLYFMLGLPGEKMADVKGISDLAKEVIRVYERMPRDLRPRRPQLQVSTSFFIPKPWTPFQWSPQITGERMNEMQTLLADAMRHRLIAYQWHDIETSVVEGVLARGDRRLGPVIEAVWQAGGWLESWREHFSQQRWLDALANKSLDPDFYTVRKREADEPFPWDHLNCGVGKAFLRREYERAQEERVTAECREKCQHCGAQGFACGICPQVKRNQESFDESTAQSGSNPEDAIAPGKSHPEILPDVRELVDDTGEESKYYYRLAYARTEIASWIGHLDVMRMFERASRRADLPLAWSQGFNPRPEMSFGLPVGVGIETRADWFDLTLKQMVDPDELRSRLNSALPDGYEVVRVDLMDKPARSLMSLVKAAVYLIEADALGAAMNSLWFEQKGPVIAKRLHKGRAKEYDLRSLILAVEICSANRVRVKCRAGSEQNMRPDLLLNALIERGLLEPETALDARIIREQLQLQKQE